ncbi:hypothetical protein F5X97DRAFT_292612 [Nemania serpens]|nr:hypothetical protein F5X97DRAFT_292612 [Nemania serpens]
MSQSRDVADLSGTGHTAIVASMVVFVILTVVIWAVMGLQIYRTHKQRLADLESGAQLRGGLVDGSLPLEDVLKGTKHAHVPSARASRSSRTSWSETQEPLENQSSRSGTPSDTRWYAEERPIRFVFHKIRRMFKKQGKPLNANVADP